MAGRLYPLNVLEQAHSTLGGWNGLNPPLPAVGEITPTALDSELAQAQALQAEFAALESQLTELRNRRDNIYANIWDKVKRVRSVVKGLYGDDSTQYEQVGGTRRSERKRPVRKAKGA